MLPGKSQDSGGSYILWSFLTPPNFFLKQVRTPPLTKVKEQELEYIWLVIPGGWRGWEKASCGGPLGVQPARLCSRLWALGSSVHSAPQCSTVLTWYSCAHIEHQDQQCQQRLGARGGGGESLEGRRAPRLPHRGLGMGIHFFYLSESHVLATKPAEPWG